MITKLLSSGKPAQFLKSLLFLTAVVIFGGNVNAQVSTYNFNQAALPSLAVVDPLTTPTVLIPTGTLVDDAIYPVSFPTAPAFTFRFNGVAYSGMNISTNGFVYFDNAPFATVPITTIQPLASTVAYDGAIAVLAQDLIFMSSGTATQLQYSVEGTYPDRHIIVEWTARRKNTSTSSLDSGVFKFQLHLYEDAHTSESNTIVMKYNETSTTAAYATTNRPSQIGLRGAVGDAFALSHTPNTTWPTIGFVAPTSTSGATVSTSRAANIGPSASRLLTWRPGTCFVPTGLAVNSITDTGATLNWTDPFPVPAGYQYEIRTGGLPGTAGAVQTGNPGTNSVSVSSLAANTTYTVYVRSSCGGPFSLWSGGVTFTTKCAPQSVPYWQFFDPVETPFTPPALPACNSVVQAGTGNLWTTEGPDYGADFFDEHLVYNSTASLGPADTWFFTNGITLTAGVPYRISYIYGGSFGPMLTNKMNVAFGQFADPGSMVNAISNHADIKTSPLEFVGNFTVATSGVYYFGFHAYSAINMGKLYLDDIQVQLETCLAPTLITVPAGTMTPNSAVVNFTPPAVVPGDGYQYFLSTSNIAPEYSTTATGTVMSGASFPLSGLSQLTTYYIWIRTNCGTKYSLWSPVTIFTTPGIPPSTPISMTATNYTGTGCLVTFFDSGGASGNYVDYETKTYTFTAPPGFQLKVVFNNFSTENNYDGLMIYNGPSTGSPVIPSGLPAGFNATTAPANSFYGLTSPGTFYSTNGAITFKFTSDVSIQSSGWSASMTCVVAPTVASFTPANNACSPGTTVTVNGTNFAPGAVVSFNGISAVTTFVSTTQLTAVLPANATTGLVSVTSGSPVATGSSSMPFTVYQPGPTTTGVSICAESPATQLLTSATVCSGYTIPSTPNTITGSWTAGSPSAVRQNISTNSTVCSFSSILRQYSSIDFQVSVTGVYSFEMNSGTDGMGYITQGSFTPGVCSPGFVIGDDDSGAGLDPRMTVALNAGITYTLYSTTYSPTTAIGFTWTITPPAGENLLLYSSGVMEWWTASTGGTKLFTGNNFNPVGVDPTLTNTNAAVIKTYYAACSTNPFCRTATVYEIKPLPTVAMSGAGSNVCSGAVTAITASGTANTYIWSSTVSNSLFTDAAGTVAYNGTDSLLTIYLKASATATVTLTGTITATGCSKTITGVYSVNTKTWNGTVWSPAGAPTGSEALVFNGNYTSTGDLAGCSCTVNSPAIVSFEAGHTLRLDNGLTVNTGGSLTFQNTASLLQISNSVVNSGNITYKRTASMRQFDYTYWSSPVFPQTLASFSPLTLADKYHWWNAASGSYGWATVAAPGLTNMTPGQGYIIRAPQGTPTTPAPWTGSFIGVANNGVHTIPVTYTPGPPVKDLNLLGNPYPSALNADLLLSTSGPNASILGGTLYFWTHNTPINPLQYSASDYASYNLVGGVGTGFAAGGVGNTTVPTGKIAAGQGFFAKAIGTGVVTFNNSMRIGGNNSNFYRMSDNNPTEFERSRVWLELKNELGAYKQILVGYLDTATNGIDTPFDGEAVEAGNVVSLYSLVENNRLSIQGRALPFFTSDLVPLGYRSDIAGNFEINLSDFDGLFQSQDIYLEDSYLNVIHNLKIGSYSFESAIGTFDDRFVLRYTDSSLGINAVSSDENAVIAYKMGEALHISSRNAEMKQVKIFDVRGRLLAEKKDLSDSEVVFDNLSIAQEVLLVQVTLTDGTVVTKKTLF